MLLYFFIKSKKPKSERGFFGYYSLIDWWETKFSDQEKSLFKEAFEDHCTPISFENLFSGVQKPYMENGIQRKNAVRLLGMISNHLATVNGSENIMMKILDKCSQLIYTQTDQSDLYFYYLSQINLYSKLKQINSSLESHTAKSCLNTAETFYKIDRM